MKKIFVIVSLTVIVIGCSKKIAPVTTATPEKQSEATPVIVDAATKVVSLESGKLVYEAKCGKCHDLPAVDNYSAGRWVGLVDWMAPKAKLAEQEKADVLAYVQANAKK